MTMLITVRQVVFACRACAGMLEAAAASDALRSWHAKSWVRHRTEPHSFSTEIRPARKRSRPKRFDVATEVQPSPTRRFS